MIIIVFPLLLNVSMSLNGETSQLLLVCFCFIRLLHVLCKYYSHINNTEKSQAVILPSVQYKIQLEHQNGRIPNKVLKALIIFLSNSNYMCALIYICLYSRVINSF